MTGSQSPHPNHPTHTLYSAKKSLFSSYKRIQKIEWGISTRTQTQEPGKAEKIRATHDDLSTSQTTAQSRESRSRCPGMPRPYMTYG